MNELVEQFLSASTSISNIQPYAISSVLSHSFIALSIVLLVLIIFRLRFNGIRFFEVFFPFLLSENYSLSFYKVKIKYGLVDVLLALFFVLQVSFLLFSFAPKSLYFFDNQWVNFFIFFGAAVILFLGKLLVYSSLRHLLPSKVDVRYFGFNYAFWCFYFGIFLFLLNLLFLTSFSSPSIYYLFGIVGLFYLFLIIRVISISLRYNILGSLYIIVYFCTLEISPFIVFWHTNGVFR